MRITKIISVSVALFIVIQMSSCSDQTGHDFSSIQITAEEILGDSEYQAISFGAYREATRDIQPTIPQLKEDVKILHAMGVRLLRTYNVHYDEAANLLQAIREIREDDSSFEMYLMLGAWIDARHAWTDEPERFRDEDSPRNAVEIETAVELAQQYPEIVKIIAVGNEAMVHWAAEYYVEPSIILNWVNHLQDLKSQGELPETLWITSSDDFSAWGGGDPVYHTEDLNALIEAVDFISMHTYPMHNSHYNPEFWGVPEEEEHLSDMQKINSAMDRSLELAVSQYDSVVSYMQSIGVDKPVHIGETGWATVSNEYYGPEGSRATDEYKSGLYYKDIREWSNRNNISVFYFEAFDEPWKDAQNPLGSENHFGLINLEAEAKYAIWDLVDAGVFDELTRDGMPITKTYDGDLNTLLEDVMVPPTEAEIEERQRREAE